MDPRFFRKYADIIDQAENAPVIEGWRGTVAGLALGAGLGAWWAHTPSITVDGQDYQQTDQTPPPSATTVTTSGGHAATIWHVMGPGGRPVFYYRPIVDTVTSTGHAGGEAGAEGHAGGVGGAEGHAGGFGAGGGHAGASAGG